MSAGMRRGLSTAMAVLVLGAGLVPIAPASAQAGLSLTPNPVDFGVVPLDSVVRRTVTVTNTSGVPITPSGFVMSSDLVNLNPSNSTCARGVALPAGGQCTLEVFTFPLSPASFEGVTLSVITNDGEVAATATMTGTVADRPSPPRKPSGAYRELLPRGGSRIVWQEVPGASAYEVQSSGRVVCRAAAPRLSCVSDKAFGPRIGLWIMAANDAGVSDAAKVRLRSPENPVTFATIDVKGRSGTLNKKARKQAAAVGAALLKQGFYRDITVVGGTKSGVRVAAARAEAVRAIVLSTYERYDVDDAVIRTEAAGAGNAVTITVR